MKRFLFMLITAAAALTAAAQSQGIVYGARAGFEITMPEDSHNLYKTGSGFQAGAIARIGIPRNFFVEPGLFFYFTSMDSRYLTAVDGDDLYQGQAKIYGLRIPVNVGYALDIAPDWTLNFSTGPYMNINLRARQNYEPNFGAAERVPKGSTDLFDHGWKRVEAGWGVGVSVTYAGHYELGVKAGFDFTPMANIDIASKNHRLHRNMVVINLGYNF